MENEAVLISKYDGVERSIKRINEEYENNPKNLKDNRRLDAIILNLQRASEMATDVAMYIVTVRRLGIPQTRKDAFEKLYDNKLISKEMCKKMKRIIGLKNIALHEYEKIDEKMLKDIIENDLTDIKEFIRTIINLKR